MNDSVKLLTDILVRFLLVIAGAWMTKKGFSDEDQRFILGGLGTLTASLVYVIYRNFGLWKKDPPAKPVDSNSSNWSQLIAFFVLCPAVLVMASGCSSPAKRFAASMVALDGANEAFIAAANAKLLTDKQIVSVEPLFKAADNQVQILQDEFESNGTINESALKSLNNAIDAIQEWLIRVRARN